MQGVIEVLAVWGLTLASLWALTRLPALSGLQVGHMRGGRS